MLGWELCRPKNGTRSSPVALDGGSGDGKMVYDGLGSVTSGGWRCHVYEGYTGFCLIGLSMLSWMMRP